MYRAEWFCDGCAADRSLRSSSATTGISVAADEQREAAFGREAIVNQAVTFYLLCRAELFYDGFAADRSLAELVSCYRDSPPRRVDELCEATFDDAIVAERPSPTPARPCAIAHGRSHQASSPGAPVHARHLQPAQSHQGH